MKKISKRVIGKSKVLKKIIWGNSLSLHITIVVVTFLLFVLCIAGCTPRPNYEEMDAVFIGEEASLHNNDYVVTVLSATTVDEITVIVNEKQREAESVKGHYIAITICIRKNPSCKENCILDKNDFKLKDHTGTHIPLSVLSDFVDFPVLDIDADSGDSVNSNAVFDTRKAVKDYTWVGSEVVADEDMVFTLYFKMSSDLDVENTIMVLEVDFRAGFGQKTCATDIVLFKRKEPIR